MKRLIFILSLAVIMIMQGNSQVYDGITQPTKHRSITIFNNNGGVTQLFGEKFTVTDQFSTTAVYKYQGSDVHVLETWNNVNFLDNKLYFLSRIGYNFKSDLVNHTLSGTWKYFTNSIFQLHTDFTWYNQVIGNDVFTEDALQIMAGMKLKDWFVINGGYRVIGEGSVFNFRFLFPKNTWLQFKYMPKQGVLTIASFIQLNEFEIWQR